jgi:hypothetical protein
MFHHKWHFIVFSLLFVIASPFLTRAQTPVPPPSNLVYACIDNGDGTPALVTFRDTDMTDHIVGLIVPQTAMVTIYGPTTPPTGVGVYAIRPDAATGGYQRSGQIAKVSTRDDIPVQSLPCSTQYPDLITNNLLRTIPLPVSKDQAVIIQFGADSLLETAEILGVFTLHFRPINGTANADLQLLQLSGGSIEISFPFITEDTRVVLMSNKDVSLRISLTANKDDFLAQNAANPTDGFSHLLAREPVNTDTTQPRATLSLSQIMQEGAVRIYPAVGLISTYPTGGFIRLEMSPVAAQRVEFSQLAVGTVFVRAIQGLQAQYFILNNPNTAYNTLTNEPDMSVPPKTLEVARIDDQTGELIVETPGGDAFIESWFVEVVPPQ